MKFNFCVDIGVGRAETWQAFEDLALLPEWQSALVSVEHKTGVRGQPGSVAELCFRENGRRVVVQQTITERRKPDFRAAIHESAAAKALIVDTFDSLPGGGTRWSSWINVSFRGATRFVALFAARTMRRHVEEDMQRFKLLVETRAAEADR
ncbi:MAG: SRPBCC family protein [Gammaproteobacteria bacterium]|nr:SRPBCC family protein [Gammaproteobacteria bacterium]